MSRFLDLLKDDAYAASFQTLGQYRAALIAAHRDASGDHITPAARRFRHKDGFCDNTAYVQIQPNGDAYLVNGNGFSKKSVAYDLETCLAYIASGDWIELEAK
ncbi:MULTISPECIES: hypothetical protein [unclassified Burkholderia]|uniref:hypothetical protein n=1 Tax=unclassified Burkholderia TaxID=2613784 RepID=UPI000F5840C6|nr:MULTISPECIES: hypothetical protein [unclassified Burkholderia]RQR87702.1 hypothetical protein DIE10_06345 [Burkholderia sp. Bp9011]RQR97047.1 hypothetical protein DIE09_06525 [Burkholderia sp. Bp9010]